MIQEGWQQMQDEKLNYIEWYHRLFLWVVPLQSAHEVLDGVLHIIEFKRCCGKLYILDIREELIC